MDNLCCSNIGKTKSALFSPFRHLQLGFMLLHLSDLSDVFIWFILDHNFIPTIFRFLFLFRLSVTSHSVAVHPFPSYSTRPTFDAMTFWPSGRSRSRTTTPPRHRGTVRSSRSSTSTHQPPQETTSVPREVTSYRPSLWPAPERHVLAIISFQDFAELSARLEFTPNNVDYDKVLPTSCTYM